MLGKVQNVDLKLLRVFQAVSRSGGFTAAQSELNTSQSTISTAITQLEQRLGLRLCERGVKGFRLTPEGSAVLKAADNLFGSLEEFRVEVARVRRSLSGAVHIGIADNLVMGHRFFLPAAIAEVLTASGEVSMHLVTAAPLEMEAMLRDGRLECGLAPFNRKLDELLYEPLYEERHELYCGEMHPLYSVADEDIQDADIEAAQYAGREYLEEIASLQPPVALSGNSGSHHMEGLVTLVLSGKFLAYLPENSAEPWVLQKKMRSIVADRMAKSATIECAYRRSALRMKPVQLLRESLLKLYKAI